MNKVFWNYGTEGATFSGLVAMVGTGCAGLFGGWDGLMQALCMMMMADFALGILAAVKNGEIDSKVMLWGGVNKVLVLVLVAVGMVLDGVLPLSEPYVRTAIIWFYIAREGLSLVENYGKMGQTLPKFLVELLAQMKDKADGGTEEEEGKENNG